MKICILMIFLVIKASISIIIQSPFKTFYMTDQCINLFRTTNKKFVIKCKNKKSSSVCNILQRDFFQIRIHIKILKFYLLKYSKIKYIISFLFVRWRLHSDIFTWDTSALSCINENNIFNEKFDTVTFSLSNKI